MRRLIILIFFAYSANAAAHGGGLDKTGGHHNRKTGEYQCLKEPCLSTHKQVEEATAGAERENTVTPAFITAKGPHMRFTRI